jgi:hypothetical protein
MESHYDMPEREFRYRILFVDDEPSIRETSALILIQWEFPRLCRGGSSSLTFAGVHPRNSEK